MMNFNLIRPFLLTEADLGTRFEIGRPWLFLILIPALILTIIPFFRLHKSRRYNIKHIVPLFLHILILAIATTMITDINIIETTTAPEDTEIIIVADMSDSNSPMKDKMNEHIRDLIENADENTKIGVVVFANKYTYYSELGKIKENGDYLSVSGEEIKSANTNIQEAIEYSSTLFTQTDKVNKRVLLVSDGRQTVGNAWSAAKKLALNDIRLDASYFDVIGAEETAEVQMLSMTATVIEDRTANVSISVALTSTTNTSGKITFYEVPIMTGSEDDEDLDTEPKEVSSLPISIREGNNSYSVKYMAEGAGIHSVYAVVETDEGDTIEQNNTLYSWFDIDDIAKILFVDGDGTQVTSKITDMVKDEYTYEVIDTEDFPESMEELLEYDEIVMMNINFEDMPAGSTDLVKRYVEEVGRGLVFTCGTNTYNYNDSTYADNPLIDILPVDLRIDERREVIATVITVDLSSSMGQAVVGSQKNQYGEILTRYDMVLESVVELVNPKQRDENGQLIKQFEDEDYVGVVFFDADASIALPLTQLHEKEWMEAQIRYAFESYFYTHKDESNPSYENRNFVTGGTKDANGWQIKSYGTNYKFGIDASNRMLSESDADLKQMVFLSDGEPSDKNSGYDETIRRMASGGVTTSTVAIGRDQVSMLDELARLATIGHGNFNYVTSSADLSKSLVKIAEMVKGKPINERETKLEKRNDSPILIGLGQNAEYDVIQGYYGTTIKDGAKIVLSADDLRPIVAEWDIGRGHSTVYMSDLGGMWSKSLFNDDDGYANSRIVKNLLTNSLNDDVGSSGLKVSSKRTDDKTLITVELEKRLRDTEQLVAYVTSPDGAQTIECREFKTLSATKRVAEVGTPDETGTYHIEVKLVSRNDSSVFDKAQYAVVGFYPDEYDLFSVDGKSVLEDLSAAGDGEMMANSEEFYDIQREEFAQFTHDISTPAIIVLLVLFIVDLLFRHFSPKKKEKKDTMTEAERVASMRGR